VVVALLAFGGFYFYKYQELNSDVQEQSQTLEEKKARYVEDVAKVFDIPTLEEEEPTIGQLPEGTSLDEIKDVNDFYQNAEAGDILLAWQEANLSILFRPSTNKIINTSTFASPLGNAQVDVALIAPTNSQESITSTVTTKFGNVNMASTTAPKGNITKGIVVDVSGNEQEAAQEIANLLDYEVGQLPSSESAPEGVSFVIVAPNKSANSEQ
jgi:hypothetical protein